MSATRLTAALTLAASTFAMSAPAFAQAPVIKPVPGKVDMNVMASLPFMQSPRMSPDGTKVAAAFGAGDSLTYAYIDLTQPGAKPVLFAQAAVLKDVGDRDVVSWRWIGNDNIVLTLLSRENLFGQRADLNRLVGYNLKTKKLTPLAWENATGDAATIIYVDDDKGQFLLSRDTNKYGNERYFRPEVVRVDAATGKILQVVEQANPIIGSWFADGKGVVRAATSYDGDTGKQKLLYRSNGNDAMKTVQAVVDKDFVGEGLTPQVFLDEPDTAVVTSNESGYTAVYKANLKTMQLGEKLFSVKGYDVDGAVANRARTKVNGYGYAADRQRTKWITPDLVAVQQNLDETFGAGNALIVSSNSDETRFVVSASAPSQPGGFYVYDTKAGKISLLGWTNPAIKDGGMNPVKTMRYKASDGESIEAFLTFPRHRLDVKNLPVVALVHGGPYGARDYGEYDDWAQTIAEQGYVVIQTQYRGSGGYGKDWVKKGRSDGFGTRMQDDVNDAIDQFAAQGLIDKNRACIMGWSYGGYASARGAQRDPSRWRCAIAGAGVYDLPMMRDYDKEYLGTFGANYLAKGAAELSTVSPARNAGGKWAPILIVHGVRDPRVPIAQGRTLVSRLKAAGKKQGVDFEYIEQPRNGHYGRFFNKAERIQWLQGASDWLAKYNPAYVASDPDKPVAVSVTAAR